MKAQYLPEAERLTGIWRGTPWTPRARLLYGMGLRHCTLLWHDGLTLLKRIRRRVRLFLKKRLRR